jgi:hypothetical protein
MFIAHLLFLGLVALAVRVVFVWVRPRRSCRWCGGAGKARLLSGRCWRCDGAGETWRVGSGLVRRAHIALRNAYLEWRYKR